MKDPVVEVNQLRSRCNRLQQEIERLWIQNGRLQERAEELSSRMNQAMDEAYSNGFTAGRLAQESMALASWRDGGK